MDAFLTDLRRKEADLAARDLSMPRPDLSSRDLAITPIVDGGTCSTTVSTDAALRAKAAMASAWGMRLNLCGTRKNGKGWA